MSAFHYTEEDFRDEMRYEAWREMSVNDDEPVYNDPYLDEVAAGSGYY